MNNLKKIVSLIGTIIYLVLSSAQVLAQNSSPPHMPIFDETTVRQMLNSIDQGYNFTLLRAGYFGGHRKSPFPTTDGFAVLKSTLETQKTGGLKWFLLEALRGSAAFHTQEIPLDDGFDAYGLIFDNASLAMTSQAQAAVRTSVRDFVTSIDTSFKRKSDPGDLRVTDLLVKAWNVWRNLPPSAADANRPIDWARAISAAIAQDKFTAIVEDALKDTSHPPDFAMLKLAIVVLQDKEPKRAIELLKTAQQKMQPGDLSKQKWLYETWEELITDSDPNDQLSLKVTDKTQLAALVEMRKDQISYTGHGYAELLELYWRLEQNDKAAELMRVIPQPAVRAEEKIDVAKVLLTPPRDLTFNKDIATQMQGQGVDLLEKYLSSLQEIPLNPPLTRGTLQQQNLPNPLYKGELSSSNQGELSSANPGKLDDPHQSDADRAKAFQYRLSIRNQLQARYLLGRYYMRQDMVTEEGKALQTGDLKPPFHDSESAAYYDQIIQLRAALEKKLKGVEGVK